MFLFNSYMSVISDIPQYLRILLFASLSLLLASILWVIGFVYFIILIVIFIIVEMLVMTFITIVKNANDKIKYVEKMLNATDSDISKMASDIKYDVLDKFREFFGINLMYEFEISKEYLDKEEVTLADTSVELYRLFKLFCNLNIAFSSVNVKFSVDRIFIKHPSLVEYFVIYINDDRKLVFMSKAFYVHLDSDGYSNLMKILVAIFSVNELSQSVIKE